MEGLLTNGLLIVVIGIFAVSAIVGMVRGFIKIVASLAATLVIVLVVILATPFVSNAIMKLTPIESIVQKKCAEILLPDSEGTETAQEEFEQQEFSREEQIDLLENAKIPEVFRQLLLENNNGEIYESLGVSTFIDYVGSFLAKTIANLIAFLFTLLVVTIVVRTILYMLGIISDLPVLGGINRLAGGFLGLGTGLVLVWILFVAITLMYDTEIGKTCFRDIAESSFLTALYENNILLNFITKFKG